MLNIQCGSREFNLPYVVTKTVGEVRKVQLYMYARLYFCYRLGGLLLIATLMRGEGIKCNERGTCLE